MAKIDRFLALQTLQAQTFRTIKARRRTFSIFQTNSSFQILR